MRTRPVEINVKSITNLWALLTRVKDGPTEFRENTALLAALKSQHGLAKYESVEWGIKASSLNTQKRISRSLLPEGYSGLDTLRCEAAKRIAATTLAEFKTAKSKRTVAGLTETVGILKKDLSLARQDCFHLSLAFLAALNEAGMLAADFGDGSAKAKWVKIRRELLARVTLSSGGLYGNPLPKDGHNGTTN